MELLKDRPQGRDIKEKGENKKHKPVAYAAKPERLARTVNVVCG